MTGKKRPTIADVAKLANVSEATVSGILNNSSLQSPETACQVQKAMQQLGYTPRRNKLRSENRRQKKVKLIALLVPDTNVAAMDTPLVSQLSHSAERELLEHGYTLVPCCLQKDGSLPEILLKKKQVAGVIFRSSWSVDVSHEIIVQNEAILRKYPIVNAFSPTFLKEDTVGIDNQSCANWAAEQVEKIADVQDIICVRPHDYLSNSEVYLRASMFEYFLNRSGKSCRFIDDKDDGKEFVLPVFKSSSKTVIFVVAHDADVFKVADALLKCKSEVTLLAVLTHELPQSCDYKNIKTIHIDPRRVGISTAELIVRRINHPYDMTRRLLIPPIELQINTTELIAK